MLFRSEIRRVAERLDRDGIDFITFKGVALATHLYGDPSAREYVDIDLLVPPGRVADAEASLATLGYRSPLGERRVREAFIGYQRQYQLLDPDTGRALDLHWDFGGDHLPFPIGAEEVWDDPATVSFGDRRLRTLAGANLAHILGVKMNHVPYGNPQQALSSLLSGDVTFMFYGSIGILPMVKSGQLRPIATGRSEEHTSELQSY